MFLLETARRRSSSRTLNFEDYLQESLILEEEWSAITERTMTKQHIALTERSNRLLNESIRDGYEKVKEWFKKAWVAIKKFFKWLFQYIAGFVANKSKWVMRNKRLIISGADRLDSKDKKLEIPEALYNAIKSDVAYNLNKETYKKALNVMDAKNMLQAYELTARQTDNNEVMSTKEKAEEAIKDMMSDALGEYTYGGIVSRAVDRVSKMNQTRSIYKAWDRLFDRGYKNALAVIGKYYDDLDATGRANATDANPYTDQKSSLIAAFKKNWSTARSLLNLSWRLENKVSKEAFKICRRCFSASKIKDMNVRESYDPYNLYEAGRFYVGGFWSYLKRYFTGVDNELEYQIKVQMERVKTEEDKRLLIDEIEEVIHVSRNMNSDPSIFSRILIGEFISVLFTLINKANGNVAQFHGALRALIKDIEKIKVSR